MGRTTGRIPCSRWRSRRADIFIIYVGHHGVKNSYYYSENSGCIQFKKSLLLFLICESLSDGFENGIKDLDFQSKRKKEAQ
jgi:hypothetical protein